MPRAIWLMVPAAGVDEPVSQPVPLLAPGDTVIDGGNTHDARGRRTLAPWQRDRFLVARPVRHGVAGNPALDAFEGRISNSGEGRWTIQAAIDKAVPAPVLSAALYARFGSRAEADFANRQKSAMRHEFGGYLEALSVEPEAKT